MASPLSTLFSGLTRGLVMDELDAWSEEPAEAVQLVPAQRSSWDDEIDLTDARFELDE
jgi:hypothetical protein